MSLPPNLELPITLKNSRGWDACIAVIIMGIRAGKLSSPDFLDKEVLILPVSKHRHKNNNIYERDHKNVKAACAYKHFTQ